MKLEESLSVLRPAIIKTWCQIGHDVLSCAEECGETVDNEQAVESCLDADRLLLNGNDQKAHALLNELFKEHGYNKVLKFFTKHVDLN